MLLPFSFQIFMKYAWNDHHFDLAVKHKATASQLLVLFLMINIQFIYSMEPIRWMHSRCMLQVVIVLLRSQRKRWEFVVNFYSVRKLFCDRIRSMITLLSFFDTIINEYEDKKAAIEETQVPTLLDNLCSTVFIVWLVVCGDSRPYSLAARYREGI